MKPTLLTIALICATMFAWGQSKFTTDTITRKVKYLSVSEWEPIRLPYKAGDTVTSIYGYGGTHQIVGGYFKHLDNGKYVCIELPKAYKLKSTKLTEIK